MDEKQNVHWDTLFDTPIPFPEQNEVHIEIDPYDITSLKSVDDLTFTRSADGLTLIRSADDLTSMNEAKLAGIRSFLFEDVQDVYIKSNSPLTMSPNNSDDENCDSSEDEQLRIIKKKRIENQIQQYPHPSPHFKGKDYQDIEKSLSKYYEYDDKYSSKLDILITYMRGQKHIYIQSKNITEKKLYLLMIPSIVISTILAIIAPLIISESWGGGFISGLNILITSFISLMNYMKLESRTEMYLQLAKQYDKIEISLEMANNKILFLETEEDKNHLVLSKLNEIEFNLNELKEVYNILIPEELKAYFPIICHINVFSLIKKMDTYKKSLIHKFMDIKNEIRYILHKWKKENAESSRSIVISLENVEKIKEKTRLLFLYDVKDNIKKELSECKNIYTVIDEYFAKEIKSAERMRPLWVIFCGSLCKKKVFDKYEIQTNNHIVDKYFKFIFDD